MNHLDRVRDVLPVAAALYALLMAANIQAAHRPPQVSGSDVGRVMAGLEWHMLQIARNEKNEALFFPGN